MLSSHSQTREINNVGDTKEMLDSQLMARERRDDGDDGDDEMPCSLMMTYANDYSDRSIR